MNPEENSASRPAGRQPYISDITPARNNEAALPSSAPSSLLQPAVAATTASPATIQPSVIPAEPEQHPKPKVYDDTAPPHPDGGKDPDGRRKFFGILLAASVVDALSIAGVLASALLLAYCLISFVFQSYQVDGPSMQTTLQNSDHLIVWKVPRTIAKITHHPYVPNRGDVIVFNEPNLADYGQPSNKQLIKRVIGLPGDHVVVKDGVVTIYNSAHPDGFDPDKTLPYGSVIVTTPGNIDVTLSDSQIFACGDNRTNSMDSRLFGPVDANNIVGKLVVRVLPLDTFKKF